MRCDTENKKTFQFYRVGKNVIASDVLVLVGNKEQAVMTFKLWG
jgi:hypothetical protein